MDSLKYCLICIAAIILIICIREYENRFAIFIRIAASIGLAVASASMFSGIYVYISNNSSWLNINNESREIFTVMLKMTGISFIGCISSSICRDSGESGIATSLEGICKLEIILLCLPLIDIIIEKIQGVMG